MPPTPEQPNSVPPPATSAPTKMASTAIKVIRVFLLVLIIIGLGLIATEKLWVPKLVEAILGNSAPVVTTLQTTTSTQTRWHSVNNVTSPTAESDILVSPYTISKSHVLYWYRSDGSESSPNGIYSSTTQADPQSFLISNIYPEYAKDTSHVYFGGDLIAADPSSFEVLVGTTTYAGGYTYNGWPTRNGYAKDSNAIYFTSAPISGADSSTFEPLEDKQHHLPGYAKDKNNVYIDDHVLPGADADSFIFVEDANGAIAGGRLGWAKDKNRVYNGEQVIDGADPATFVSINDSSGNWTGYAKDKNRVYRTNFVEGTSVIDAANPATFVVPAQ